MRFPYIELQMNKDGFLLHDLDLEAAIQSVPDDATDLFVAAHGWNNHIGQARTLYNSLFDKFDRILRNDVVHLPGCRFAVLGILWPSKKFVEPSLIPGGAASFDTFETPRVLRHTFNSLKSLLDDAMTQNSQVSPQQLLPYLSGSPSARREFVARIRESLDPGSQHPDDATDNFFALSEQEIIEALSFPAGESVQAASLGGGISQAILRLLNFTTYYVMKDRAGKVGRNGLHHALDAIYACRPDLRFHLIGHSFGGRLVTAATQVLGSARPKTLHLLQAAFSHHGFAPNGAFRDVIASKRVAGPIVITHTRNDKALGWAYAIASRLAAQDAAALGDQNDRYGGIGSNGARNTPESIDGVMQPVAGGYAFTGESIPYNLLADDCISRHSGIARPEVAYAILSAVRSTSLLPSGETIGRFP